MSELPCCLDCARALVGSETGPRCHSCTDSLCHACRTHQREYSHTRLCDSCDQEFTDYLLEQNVNWNTGELDEKRMISEGEFITWRKAGGDASNG